MDGNAFLDPDQHVGWALSRTTSSFITKAMEQARYDYTILAWHSGLPLLCCYEASHRSSARPRTQPYHTKQQNCCRAQGERESLVPSLELKSPYRRIVLHSRAHFLKNIQPRKPLPFVFPYLPETASLVEAVAVCLPWPA